LANFGSSNIYIGDLIGHLLQNFHFRVCCSYLAITSSIFHALCLDVGNISEDEKLDRFIRGLKQRVQQEVELQDPQNVETAMQIAQRIDSIPWTGRMRQQHQQPAQFNSWRNASPNQGFRVKRELNSINQNADEESKRIKCYSWQASNSSTRS
jgi:hypothetical protein